MTDGVLRLKDMIRLAASSAARVQLIRTNAMPAYSKLAYPQNSWTYHRRHDALEQTGDLLLAKDRAWSQSLSCAGRVSLLPLQD